MGFYILSTCISQCNFTPCLLKLHVNKWWDCCSPHEWYLSICLSIFSALYPCENISEGSHSRRLSLFWLSISAHSVPNLLHANSQVFIHSIDPIHWWPPHEYHLNQSCPHTLFSNSSLLILLTCPDHLRAPHFTHSTTSQSTPLAVNFLHPILTPQHAPLIGIISPHTFMIAVLHSTFIPLMYATIWRVVLFLVPFFTPMLTLHAFLALQHSYGITCHPVTALSLTSLFMLPYLHRTIPKDSDSITSKTAAFTSTS